MAEYKDKWNYTRVRNKYVNFRLTPKEAELLDKYVKLSGLLKQDYLTSKILNRDVVVKGNPRVFKALKSTMLEILKELKRIEDSSGMDKDFRDLVKYIANLYERLNE